MKGVLKVLSNNKKLIAVIGATGQQGGGVVRALQASGQFKVRALTRNPDKHRELAEEVVEADLNRPETLAAALLAQAGRCRRQGCAYRLCRQERGRGERVLRGSNGGGRDRQRQARRAPVLRSPLLRCERFRSRRLQSRGGLQELATPPIIEPRNAQ